MSEIAAELLHWQLDVAGVRERERWHALWLLSQGWTAAKVAEMLERDAHTIGDCLTAFRSGGAKALAFEQSGGSPRPRACGADHSEAGGASATRCLRSCLGKLVLEGSAAIHSGTVRQGAWAQGLPTDIQQTNGVLTPVSL